MAVYYVSSIIGDDSNGGTSPTSPFATLQAAADQTKPGDSVEVENGTYTNPGNGGNVLTITTSGTASAPIIYEAAAGQHPVIDTTGQWTGIFDNGASYVTIRGFEILGNAATITQAYAQSQANNTNNPTTSSTGIDVGANGDIHPVNVIIANNIVHHQPGAGIQVSSSDYVSILGNTVYDNAWWSPFANSGISIFKMYSSDLNSGYKTTIMGNTVYGNQEYIPWHVVGAITDGNGIIVDSNNLTQYNGRTLVENNLTYYNGGTGAHAYNSNNVDFFYNTAYLNNQSPNLNEGQIVSQSGTGVRIENNIMVAPNGDIVNGSSNGSDVIYDYNIYGVGGIVSTLGGHDIVADPLFVAPSAGNFSLQAGSPAIDSANPSFVVPSDIAGNPRMSGAGYDRGAYEYVAATPPATDTVVLKIAEDAWRGNAKFNVSIDGNRIAGPLEATTLHSSGTWQSFQFAGAWGDGPHQVSVSYINDAWGGNARTDRNLYLGGISYNGTAYDITAKFASNGTKTFTVG